MAGVLLLERGYIFRVFDGKKRCCAWVSGAESNHSVYGALSNNLSHIGLQKQDRRLLLRIIWLNHDKHVKAGGDGETDQWPMPFLFEQQHHKWESFFSARPFDRVPDLSKLAQCVPCVGYDYVLYQDHPECHQARRKAS